MSRRKQNGEHTPSSMENWIDHIVWLAEHRNPQGHTVVERLDPKEVRRS